LAVLAGVAGSGTAHAAREGTLPRAVATPTLEDALRGEAWVATFLDCARLTHGSLDVPLDAVLGLAPGAGRALFRWARTPDGEPLTLLCPAEVALARDVLGPSGGQAWGAARPHVPVVHAWCSRAPDGSPLGCAAEVGERVTATPGGPLKGDLRGVDTALSRDDRPPARSGDRRHEALGLGVDLSPAGRDRAAWLRPLEGALASCLDVAQPWLDDRRPSGVVLRVVHPVPVEGRFPPAYVVGVLPRRWQEMLLGCVNAQLGGVRTGGEQVHVLLEVRAERPR
jgi:hypothetical protein